jgi:hypothetical protein
VRKGSGPETHANQFRGPSCESRLEIERAAPGRGPAVSCTGAAVEDACGVET